MPHAKLPSAPVRPVVASVLALRIDALLRLLEQSEQTYMLLNRLPLNHVREGLLAANRASQLRLDHELAAARAQYAAHA